MKSIIDVCCGNRMFWFNKINPNVLYCDKRLEVCPDVVCDFTDLPFPDKSFKLVVFDPPHLMRISSFFNMALKYGVLPDNWQEFIKSGFDECLRVLDDYGTLIFKWSEVEIKVSEITRAVGKEPLFGHQSGRRSGTHWLCYMKIPV